MTWIWGEGGTWQLVDKTGMFAMTFSFNAWEVLCEHKGKVGVCPKK